MRHLVAFFIFVALVVAACGKTKPSMTGRLSGPTALAKFKGCSQKDDSCVGSEHQLLLITNSFSNDLRIFDVTSRNFFTAPEPLFPLSIPVGELPVSLAIDPHGEFAFVVNAVSQNVSLVDLAMNQLVEVDTDANTTTHAAELDPQSDRALAGVSRVGFALYGDVQPEYIVAPPQDVNWDKTKPLMVYVSLLATGQIAVLNFQYPDKDAGTPQRLDLLEIVTVGGMPSGMAITKDGSKLFIANEELSDIHMIDTTVSPMTFVAIGVGGPSRRLALTSDDSKLFIVHSKINSVTNTGEISVFNATVDPPTRCAPQNEGCIPLASDATLKTIQIADPVTGLPELPRSITFVDGLTLSVDSQDYKFQSQGDPVTSFAYVSNLGGTVYIVDVKNNYPVINSENKAVRFVPSLVTGMDGDLISGNFSTTSTNDYRIFMLSEGSNAMMEFFPKELSATNYLLYQ